MPREGVPKYSIKHNSTFLEPGTLFERGLEERGTSSDPCMMVDADRDRLHVGRAPF